MLLLYLVVSPCQHSYAERDNDSAIFLLCVCLSVCLSVTRSARPITNVSCRLRTRTTRYVTTTVLYTKVDGQCDQPSTVVG